MDDDVTPGAEPRNLVVCCDGTGNLWAPNRAPTNVVRLFLALAKDARQIAYYDPGVGTPDGAVPDGAGTSWRSRLSRLKELSVGSGVWVNVAQAYTFLMRHYRPGDRIYLFGFSRGAFTVRAVSGILHMVGLLKPHHENVIPTVLRLYFSRANGHGPQPGGTDRRADKLDELHFRENFCIEHHPRVHFIGVWDTVDSVGLPMLGRLRITSAVTFDRTKRFDHVRQALALDETRCTFDYRPYALNPDPEIGLAPTQSLKQVWFAGAHSDVGGGYDEAGLSNASLLWMAQEAHDKQLRLKVTLAQLAQENRPAPCGLMHDQVARSPAWALAGVRERRVCGVADGIGPVLHESVAQRSRAGYRVPVQACRPEPAPIVAARRRAAPATGFDIEPWSEAVRPHVDADCGVVAREGPGQGLVRWGLFSLAMLAAFHLAYLPWATGSGQGAWALFLDTVQVARWQPLLLADPAQAGRQLAGGLLALAPGRAAAHDLLHIVAYLPALAAVAFLIQWGLARHGRPGRVVFVLSFWLPWILVGADAVENVLTAWSFCDWSVLGCEPLARLPSAPVASVIGAAAIVKLAALAAVSVAAGAGAIGALLRLLGHNGTAIRPAGAGAASMRR